MNKDKITAVQIFTIVGALIWCLTILMRETTIMENELLKFILGVTPNIGAVWVMTGIGVSLYTSFMKKKCGIRTNIIILILVFVFMVCSEIYHDIFLNSPFDIYDIICSVLASIIIGLVLLITNTRAMTCN